MRYLLLALAIGAGLNLAVVIGQAYAATNPDGTLAVAEFKPGLWQDRTITSRIDMWLVDEWGSVGELYSPKGAVHLAAVISLGACTPDTPRSYTQGMADHGYVALALFYCGPDNSQLREIPLEHFKAALDWLREQPEVDRNRIGLIGASAGGQAALLIAATYPEVKAVVAIVPGSVIWQAPLQPLGTPARSGYTLGDKPLPFVPTDSWTPDALLHRLNDLAPYRNAIIPVERINGPILLISGTEDRSWPSAVMADQVMSRLTANHFPFEYEHLRYPDAGHGFFAAHDSQDPAFVELVRRYIEGISKDLGGTVEGNKVAQADSWPKTLAFFHKHL